MPTLQEEEKRQRLIELGLDPDKYDMRPMGSPIAEEQAPANNSNTLGALGTGARKSIGSTVGGVGATAGTLAASLALFPEPTGATKLASLVLALGSGLAGAYAGGKAQEKLEPIIRGEDEQATQARLAKEAQLAEDNQVASFVGEQLPSAAFFRPSITGIKNAVKGASNMGRLSGIELSAAQKAALANAGVNAGIGGGVSIASDLVDDNEVSIPRALAHAGVGALMNEPTRIGQRLGFHSSPKEQDFSSASTEVPLIKRIKDPNRMLPAPAVKGEDVIIPPYEGTDLQKKADFAKAKVEQTYDANSAKNTDAVTEAKPVSQNTLNITKPALERSILENQIPRVTVKDSTLSDNTGNIERANAEINTPLTEAERIQEDYDNRYQKVNKEKEPIIVNEPKTFAISKETAQLLAKRGIKATAGEVYIQNPDGSYPVDGEGKFIRARGSANIPSRSIKLDIAHAQSDTPYHEAAHIHYPEANENTIEQVGKEYVDRLPEGEMKKFFKDLLGSKERKMAAKLHEDAPYNESIKNPNVNVGDGIRNQDIDAKTQVYNQKYNILLQLMREGKLESPEGKSAWKDFEDYKNTHFAGNTPEGYNNKVKQGTVNKYQPIQQDTPEFKKWFGDSKVVDKEGKPLIVYHSSQHEFNSFDKTKAHDAMGMIINEGFGPGKFYFAKDKNASRDQAGKQTNLMPVYLKAENPINRKDWETLFNSIREEERKKIIPQKGWDRADIDYEIRRATINRLDEYLKSKGYDSIDGGWEIAVFEPTQIKSATGNRGTFDSNNPDIRFQPIKDFELSTEREIRKERPFNLVIAEDGTIPTQNLLGRLRSSSQISKGELHALEESGLKEYLKGKSRIDVGELQDWIKENGPRVEVRKAGADQVSGNPEDVKIVNEFNNLLHEMETGGMTYNGISDSGIGGDNIIAGEWHPKFTTTAERGGFHVLPDLTVVTPAGRQVKIEKMTSLTEIQKQQLKKFYETWIPYSDASDRVSYNNPNWSTVGPLEKMPGYVEIAAVKSGVKEAKKFENGRWVGSTLTGQKFNSSHSFPPNTIAWVRGFVETLPNGEKVFRIIELQSDWAQRYKKDLAIMKERNPQLQGLPDNKIGTPTPNDPLLDYYESIALKAAIKHAREQGINKIAIDDAETAMLTEGHDRAIVRTDNYNNRLAKLIDDFNSGHLTEQQYVDYKTELDKESMEIRQEKGMRQHYDTSIPNILRKLTGDTKGERVEFGEHKMAFDTEYGHVPNTGERRIQSMKERPDLIFKNPNGTPKTTSTGRLFDISNVLVEKPAEPYRSTFYQRIDNTGTPEVDNYNPGTPRKDIDGRSIGKRILDRINPLNITKGVIQNIHEIDTQHGPVLADALVNQRRGMTNYEGQFRNIVDTFTSIRNEGERDLLHRVLLAENEHQKSFKSALPESLHSEYDQIRQTLRDMVSEQNANGEKVKDWVKNADGKWETVMRPRKVNDFYFPNMVSGDVVEALAKPDSNIAKKLKDDLIAHYEKHYGEGFGKKLGEEAFQDFTSNDGRGGDSVKFGPNRKAEGIGLPESWIEPNPISSMRRYLRRTANDLSFFKHIENDPRVARMAGIDRNQDGVLNSKDVPDLHNIPAVQNVLDIITGRAFSKSPVLDAASGIANSLLLGPISGLADLVSVPFNTIKFAPSIFDVPGVIAHGIKNFRKGLANSYETGFNKKDPLFLRDLTLPTTRLEQKLYVLRDAIYKIQGRKGLEQFSRGLSQSMMEYVVEINAAKAKNGDKSSQAFIKKLLGSNVDYNNIDIKKAGSAAAELIQGTYDFRNLPMWAIDSNIAPFFRLARWNIEQLNNFGKYVWEPAKKGNLTPLILSTFGAVAGGAIIKQMRESASDKKAYTATFNEIINSDKGAEGNLPLIAYKLIALASYTGYAGIASDLARSSMDVMMLKNKPQSIDYPFWGLIEDSTTKAMQAISAIKDGEGDVVDVGSKLASDLLKDNMQLARLANTWLLENTGLNDKGLDKREKGDKLRDLRVFKQVEGLPVSPMSESNVNPYANQDIREFKQTADIDKARKLAPQITKKALSESTYAGKVQKLEGIRKNQYATVPSPTANPSEFASYVQYIRRTQGEDAVRKLLADYNKRNAINRVKRDMIPSLRQ